MDHPNAQVELAGNFVLAFFSLCCCSTDLTQPLSSIRRRSTVIVKKLLFIWAKRRGGATGAPGKYEVDIGAEFLIHPNELSTRWHALPTLPLTNRFAVDVKLVGKFRLRHAPTKRSDSQTDFKKNFLRHKNIL